MIACDFKGEKWGEETAQFGGNIGKLAAVIENARLWECVSKGN